MEVELKDGGQDSNPYSNLEEMKPMTSEDKSGQYDVENEDDVPVGRGKTSNHSLWVFTGFCVFIGFLFGLIAFVYSVQELSELKRQMTAMKHREVQDLVYVQEAQQSTNTRLNQDYQDLDQKVSTY